MAPANANRRAGDAAAWESDRLRRLNAPRNSTAESHSASGLSHARHYAEHLTINKRGEPHAHLANAITALRKAPEYQGVLGYNEFSRSVHALSAPPWEAGRNEWTPRAWSDLDDLRVAEWLQRNGLNVSPTTAGQAAQVIAVSRSFHPVRDYLDTLEWDGITRTENWLSSYLGAEERAYTQTIGSMALISGVARVRRPGCKADSIPILEGAQGTSKSSALRILAGQWFTDEIADLGSKDAALQTRGVWIIEIAELDSMSRAEVSKVKAFISRTTDRFRPPYGQHVIESARECVFWGTTNKNAYLSDETGARRFWPIKTGRIDLDALARDRDQLWAEADEKFKKGDRWWLTGQVLTDAAEHQAERYIEDPWHHLVANHVANLTQVSIADILNDLLHIEPSRWTQSDQNRISRILVAMKWERRQNRDGEKRVWRYHRPKDQRTGDW